MKIAKNKTRALIALFLMLIITATFVALPILNAHTPAWTLPTSAYCNAVPNRIGLGQYTTIVVWLDRYSLTSGGGAGQRWDGFKIVITKPDGNNETIGPWKCRSDVANDWQVYTPDQIGEYTIVFSWPGETVVETAALNASTAQLGDIYLGSTSAPVTLIVQQEPIAIWQEPALPTDYWTRPINAANREWSSLASNWLKGTWLVDNFQRWGTAPETAHVLWTKPLTQSLAGGINDAAWPGNPSDVNDYESPWSAPIIMNGKIYYNAPAVADVASYGYYCMDLYTGEQIWYKNGTDNGLNNPFTEGSIYALDQHYLTLTQGQLYHYASVNGQGILSYLIMVSGTTWYFLDSNGNFMLKLINVPAGTSATDQDGSILKYSYNAKTGNLLCWNSSQSIPPLGPLGTNQQQWKMRLGATIDAVNDTSWTLVGPGSTVSAAPVIVPASAIEPRSGYTMNVTVDTNLPGSLTVLQDDNRVPKELFGCSIQGSMSTGSSITGDTFSAWVIQINEHVTANSPHPEFTNTQQNNLGFGATVLWKKTIALPLTGTNNTFTMGGTSYDDQVFILRCAQTMQMWGYSLETGELLWGPTPSAFSAWDMYGQSSDMYEGKVLSTGYGGTLYAYDAQTGELLWNYNASSVGNESPYGENYPLSIGAVADGKVYLYSTEHSPTKPLWRGSYLRCVNLTDGTELWKLLDFNMGLGIADGYIVSASQYDNNIYCIGKGPSATTVELPLTATTAGSTEIIQGTVTDQSPGATAYAAKYGLTTGVPAVSDADQEAWMEYIYEQQAKPTSATGVPVTIDAIDPNGNYIHIGTTTSDTSGGLFSYAWTTPNVPGKYTIIATFAGSKSYGSSSAETSAFVSEIQATAAPTPALTSVADSYFVPAIAGLFVLIIVVLALVVLMMLKKRP